MKNGYIFLGAPGSGKGTQAKKLLDASGIPSVSTGDLIRSEIKRETPLGLECKPYLTSGKLVPDTIIVRMFKHWVETHAVSTFISDGFPRTIDQAKVFDDLIAKELGYAVTIVFFEVGLETLKKRILGRLMCPKCGNIQNKFFNQPIIIGQCDRCASAFETRIDDTEEIIQTRYDGYLESTMPILEHYKSQVITIDAEQSPDEIFAAIRKQLAI